MKRTARVAPSSICDADPVVWEWFDEIDEVIIAGCALINQMRREHRYLEMAELATLLEEIQTTRLLLVEHMVQFRKPH